MPEGLRPGRIGRIVEIHPPIDPPTAAADAANERRTIVRQSTRCFAHTIATSDTCVIVRASFPGCGKDVTARFNLVFRCAVARADRGHASRFGGRFAAFTTPWLHPWSAHKRSPTYWPVSSTFKVKRPPSICQSTPIVPRIESRRPRAHRRSPTICGRMTIRSKGYGFRSFWMPSRSAWNHS